MTAFASTWFSAENRRILAGNGQWVDKTAVLSRLVGKTAALTPDSTGNDQDWGRTHRKPQRPSDRGLPRPDH